MTFLYVLIQCTWGFFQTFLGFLVFLANLTRKHYCFHGAVVTEWPSRSGVSLGLFVFIPIPPPLERSSDGKVSRGIFRRILVHEYGHTRQSLLLGPFYLPLIGLPSLIWNRLPYFRKRRKAHKKAYYAFFPERWANELGERYLREEAPGLWE